MDRFTIKDSGQRESFTSGMVRDVAGDKTNVALVFDGPMLWRWATHLTLGAVKYAKRNWMKAAGEAELERFRESAARHFAQWYRGDIDEDHAAAVIFNINGAEYVRDKLLRASVESESAHSPAPQPPASQRSSGSQVPHPSEPGLLKAVLTGSSPTTESYPYPADRESEHHTLGRDGGGRWDRSELHQRPKSQSGHKVDPQLRHLEQLQSLVPQEEEGQDKPLQIWREVDPLESMTKVNTSGE